MNAEEEEIRDLYERFKLLGGSGMLNDRRGLFDIYIGCILLYSTAL
jgi:hypothetical protein